MSCYLRHMKDIIEEAGVNLNDKEDRKTIDKVIHDFVEIEYKNCSSTWAEIKEIRQDATLRKKLIDAIKNI